MFDVWSDSRIKTRRILWGEVGGYIGESRGDFRVGANLEEILKTAAESTETRPRVLQDVRERVSETYLTESDELWRC